MPLSVFNVSEYIRLHQEKAAIEKRMEALKAELLPALVAGGASPAELPYLLVNRPQNRKQSDWKGACFTLLKKYLRSPSRAEAQLEKIDAAFETKEVPALHVVINPTFATSQTVKSA